MPTVQRVHRLRDLRARGPKDLSHAGCARMDRRSSRREMTLAMHQILRATQNDFLARSKRYSDVGVYLSRRLFTYSCIGIPKHVGEYTKPFLHLFAPDVSIITIVESLLPPSPPVDASQPHELI